MLKHRLFSVLVSSLAFLVLGGVIAQGLAVFETRITDAHDASLRLARDSIEASIEDSAVSGSRVSPMRMTSGSCRRKVRSS